MTNEQVDAPFAPEEYVLTRRRLQSLYSNSRSREILTEAKRILTQQRKEHAPLLVAFRARQRRQKTR